VPDGGPYWDAVIPRTRDAANAALLPASSSTNSSTTRAVSTNLVSADKLEFIEIHNAGLAGGSLQHPRHWRLNGGVEFSFPPDLLAAGERVVIVI
jgi:hypothetical protein